MIKIILTIDPDTGRGLYDDESQVLGKFSSVSDAETELGDLLRFCSIHSEIDHPRGSDS
jgi:hypothetical protein